MPSQPAWFHRLEEILGALRAMTFTHLDRAAPVPASPPPTSGAWPSDVREHSRLNRSSWPRIRGSAPPPERGDFRHGLILPDFSAW